MWRERRDNCDKSLPRLAGYVALFGLIATLVAVGQTAHAAQQDEIQVYDDGINKPGQIGIELHVNGTPDGRTKPDFPGEITNNHGIRVTPEFSYGLTKELEVGAYLPTERDGEGQFHFVGGKLRLKWLPVKPEEGKSGWFAGVNVEYSRVGPRFQESPSTLEMRNIIGWRDKDWLVALNPIFDWDLSKPLADGVPTYVTGLKITRKVAEGLALGGEYYSDIGKINHVLPWNEQDNRIYAVMDVDMKPFVFSFGVGRGLTDAADKWTVKAVIEVPLGK